MKYQYKYMFPESKFVLISEGCNCVFCTIPLSNNNNSDFRSYYSKQVQFSSCTCMSKINKNG